MTPSREVLAVELAARNDRCGHVDGDRICLRPAAHRTDLASTHTYEPISRVIPFS